MELSKIILTDKDKNEILRNLEILDLYCDAAENLTDDNILFLKKTIKELIGLLPIRTNPIKSFSEPFQRLVINETIKGFNERLTSLEDVRYPPIRIAKKLGYNRASLKGQSMFYAGHGNLAIAVEAQPQQGQLVTESKWVMKPDKVLNLLVICQDEKIAMANPNELLQDYNDYLKALHGLNSNTREVVQNVYHLVVKAFTRKVNPSNRQGYIMSALLSDLFFNEKNHRVDAIWYPSVGMDGCTMNIVMKPETCDEIFQMIEATESFTTKTSVGWMAYPTSECKEYDQETLKLIWKDSHILENDPIRWLMKDHGVFPRLPNSLMAQ